MNDNYYTIILLSMNNDVDNYNTINTNSGTHTNINKSMNIFHEAVRVGYNENPCARLSKPIKRQLLVIIMLMIMIMQTLIMIILLLLTVKCY